MKPRHVFRELIESKLMQLFWHHKQYTKWHADMSKKMMEQVLNQVLLTESSATNGTLQGDNVFSPPKLT